jgi:hypothetical protein
MFEGTVLIFSRKTKGKAQDNCFSGFRPGTSRIYFLTCNRCTNLLNKKVLECCAVSK